MRSYYALGPDRYHSGVGVPPAAYATSYLSSPLQGYPSSNAAYPGLPGEAMHPPSLTSFMSPFLSLPSADHLLTPLYAANAPTVRSPVAGPGGVSLQPGATVIQSFTQTSYSVGGEKMTYSVSSISNTNDQGGVDVYRTQRTTVCTWREASRFRPQYPLRSLFCHRNMPKTEPAPLIIK